MNLKEYFKDEPRGAKKEMAEYLGISLTWLGLIMYRKKLPSPELSIKIEKATQGLVMRHELRPDLFNK